MSVVWNEIAGHSFERVMFGISSERKSEYYPTQLFPIYTVVQTSDLFLCPATLYSEDDGRPVFEGKRAFRVSS